MQVATAHRRDQRAKRLECNVAAVMTPMIVYELFCTEQHRFEGWFASADDYERQRGDALLTCPVCGDAGIEKLPAAKIGGFAEEAPKRAESRTQVAPPLAAVLQKIMAQTEDVGRQFPEEARRIHYEEAPKRAIRGVATAEETAALLEEGIDVLPLPGVRRSEDLN